jgi:hypothetical protein
LKIAVELEDWKNPKRNRSFGLKDSYPFFARHSARVREKNGKWQHPVPENVPKCLLDGPMAFQPGEK